MKVKKILLNEFKQYFIDLIHQASNLENLGLTYGQTKEIIESFNAAKKNYSWETIEVVRGIQKAYNYVYEIIDSKSSITYRDALNINRLIDSYETKNKAGSWRNEFVKIGGSLYVSPLYVGRDYINRINKVLSEKITFETVVRLYADMSKMQFFVNGNKRTSLCFCNAILISNNLDFIKIKSVGKFVDSLVKYYENDKHFDKFLNLIQRWSLFNFDNNIKFNDRKSKIIALLNKSMSINNITQSQLARQVGVTKSYINQITSAKKIPSIEIAKKIGRILKINWKEFY